MAAGPGKQCLYNMLATTGQTLNTMAVSRFAILGHRSILARTRTRQLKTDVNHVCGSCTVLPTREGQRGIVIEAYLLRRWHPSSLYLAC